MAKNNQNKPITKIMLRDRQPLSVQGVRQDLFEVDRDLVGEEVVRFDSFQFTRH